MSFRTIVDNIIPKNNNLRNRYILFFTATVLRLRACKTVFILFAILSPLGFYKNKYYTCKSPSYKIKINICKRFMIF